MHNPVAVAKLLCWKRYHEAWPKIPEKELEGSSVSMRLGDTDNEWPVLLHKRRVNDQQRLGNAIVFVCADCYEAFSQKQPRMCRFALANHLWVGRWLPLFRAANVSHQMLLALARIVTTKIVLRPEGNKSTRSGDGGHAWDFLYNQSGMTGTAILFGNASCTQALQHFPRGSVQGQFAVSFVGKLDHEPCAEDLDHGHRAQDGLSPDAEAAQLAAKRAVKGIARLKVSRSEFDAQAHKLRATNVVYAEAEYKSNLVARWCPARDVPAVPPIIIDNVIAVPPDRDEDPDVIGGGGRVVAGGPGDATAAGATERADTEAEAAKQSRFISAFSPDDIQGAAQSAACLEIASLQHQLEEIDNATKRSVAAEVKSAIEGGAALTDEAGQERILEECRQLRKTCERVTGHQRLHKIQTELQKAALGQQTWQSSAGAGEGVDQPQPSQDASESGTIAELGCPRGSAPLSLWNWEVWAQARPTLWTYGDAGNLDPKCADAPLLTHEWITLMCMREEMEYDVEGDPEPYCVRLDDNEPEVNRFAGDWITLHIFASLSWLVDRHQSAFSFLKNGGMKWAEKVRHLTPEALASSARLAAGGGGGIKAILANKHVPQLVREALNAMLMAFADVLGTDGHRRLCRHEGVAYMQLFGPPIIFCTPNLADTKQLLLLIVQGEELRLDDDDLVGVELPRYRDMM